MGVLSSLTVDIISQCVQISKHRAGHLKNIQCLLVNHTSVKLEKILKSKALKIRIKEFADPCPAKAQQRRGSLSVSPWLWPGPACVRAMPSAPPTAAPASCPHGAPPGRRPPCEPPVWIFRNGGVILEGWPRPRGVMSPAVLLPHSRVGEMLRQKSPSVHHKEAGTSGKGEVTGADSS